jgi:Flp pilus assembly secretin CpaC
MNPMRRNLALALAVAAGLTGGQAFAGSGVAVPMDEVRTVAFAKPVATVYVGNPAIADINMIDARHAFVLGKSFGTTNIIALDNSGHEVANTFVSVSGSNGSMVTLMKGATQTTFSCTGKRCEVAPLPGDARYGDVSGDFSKHQDMGSK